MQTNMEKSQVVHVRNHQRPRCDKDLILDLQEMAYVSEYKYLGCWIDEFLNNERTVTALTAAAGRSFGRIVNIFKHMGDMGYHSYGALYDAYVLPVANYGAAVWGYKDYSSPQVLQNRIQRFFLGVHRFAPLPALRTEMDWIGMQQERWIEMLRYLGRIARMDESRLPKKILRLEIATGMKGWMGEINEICNTPQIPNPIGPYQSFIIYDLDPIRRKLITKSREEWEAAAQGMSKLKLYVQVREFMDITKVVRARLPRGQRSILGRLLCGILPLEVEIGRFAGKDKKKKDRSERLCKVCNSGQVEDELHFIFNCPSLDVARNECLATMLLSYDPDETKTEVEKLRWMLQEENIAQTAQIIERLFYERQDKLFKVSTIK